MNENEYIENYFTGTLSADEMKLFDEKIQNDPVFAEDVAFYYSAMQAIKSAGEEEKKKRFRELYNDSNNKSEHRPLRRLWPYVAAAAVIVAIVIGVYLFGSSSTPKQMADNFLQEKWKTMNVTMGVEDSMQKGKDLYNAGRFTEALVQFQSILSNDTGNIEAKKNAGIVCLKLQQYDKALEYFMQLENVSLRMNPGKFYHALTLIKRDKPGDNEQAKILLKEVVRENLEEHTTAERWLKKL